MLDYIDSQRGNPESPYHGFDLASAVFGKNIEAKKRANDIYTKYNPANSSEKIDAILREIEDPEQRFELLSRCFGINELKEYYNEHQDIMKHGTFLFYAKMISNYKQ
jgi:hypothetical protein